MTPDTLVLRRSLADRILLVVALAVVAAAALALLGLGLAILGQSPPLALLMVALAALMAALGWLVLRETRARWSTHAAIGPASVRLSLPAQRGFAPLPTFDGDVPLSDIAAVQTRSEAYRSLGLTSLQQVYALELTSGARIVLGADRPWVEPLFGKMAQAIAERAGKAVEDRGVYDAKTGALGVVGNVAPDWNAAPLPAEVGRKRRSAAALTLQITMGLILLAIVIRVLVNALH